MFQRFLKVGVVPLMFVLTANAAPKIVQSSIIHFPINGRVVVQASEEIGQFPRMRFISESTSRVLLDTSITDKEKWLIPNPAAGESQPNLRFSVIRTSRADSPTIMSVGVFHGVSDDAFFLTVFKEVKGQIRRLNASPFFANIQGGFYWGQLGKKYGNGLAVWTFVWGRSLNESHYSLHKYTMEIYTLQGSRLRQVVKRISRKMYDSDRGADSFRELGIKVFDQRNRIPRIKDSIDVQSD